MPQLRQLRRQRTVTRREDFPVTPETIRLALEQQQRERDASGLIFDGDKPIGFKDPQRESEGQ